MPCYNHARYLAEAIESVLSQSFGDLELITVDDCSHDNSGDIILKYSLVDKRVIPILHEQNVGEAKSRNDAMSKARGDYIAFCDSDDLWEVNKLDKQVLILESRRDYNVCHSDSIIIDENGATSGITFSSLHQKGMTLSGDIFHQLCVRNFINVPTVLMRRQCVEDAGFFEQDFKYLTDWLYWLKVAKKSRFLYVGEILARYRVHSGSTAMDEKGYVPYRIKAYNFILDHFPDIPDKTKSIMYYSLGEQFHYLQERESAKECYLKAIRTHQFNLKACFRLLLSLLVRDDVL